MENSKLIDEVENAFAGEKKDTICDVCGNPANSQTDFCPRCEKIICIKCVLEGHYLNCQKDDK